MKRHILLLCAAVLLIGCNKVAEHLPGKRQSAPIAIPVEVLSAGDNTSATAVIRSYVGEVKAGAEMPLYYPLGGQLLALHVANGDRVRVGQAIADVDTTSAAALHQTALAVLRQAEDAYERLRQVYDKGVVSDVKWVEMQTNLEKAQQNELATRKSLQDCHLVAKTDGFVSGLDVHVGQQLMPGQQVCRITDTRTLSVEFSVPEQDVADIRVGTPVKVDISAIRAVLDGRVSEKAISANNLSHSFIIRASLNAAAENPLPGMVCKVNISSCSIEGIILPGRCIQTTPDGPCVWVIADGKAERRHITVDGYTAQGVQVSDLPEGSLVVISGYQKLYNGAEVTY